MEITLIHALWDFTSICNILCWLLNLYVFHELNFHFRFLVDMYISSVITILCIFDNHFSYCINLTFPFSTQVSAFE